MELTKEAICTWTFVSWKVFDYWLLLAINQSVQSLFHHDSVLVGCMFLGTYAFLIGEGNGTPLHTLAWKIPWIEEPGRLQSTGSRRVWHNWVTSLSLFTFIYWRRKWQPTPVFLPGESQGRGSLVGCYVVAQSRTRLKRLSSSSSSSIPEGSSGFPYFLQFKSEFGYNEFMIWATFSSQSCFCCIELLYRAV